MSLDDRRLDRVQVEVAGAQRGHEHVREEIARLRRGRDCGRAVVQQREEVDVQLPDLGPRHDCLRKAEYHRDIEHDVALRGGDQLQDVINDLTKYLGKIKASPS